MSKYDDMSIDELIKEINFYAKKNKEEGLTDEELIIRDDLRQRYLKWFRSNTKKQLDNITFEVVSDDK